MARIKERMELAENLVIQHMLVQNILRLNFELKLTLPSSWVSEGLEELVAIPILEFPPNWIWQEEPLTTSQKTHSHIALLCWTTPGSRSLWICIAKSCVGIHWFNAKKTLHRCIMAKTTQKFDGHEVEVWALFNPRIFTKNPVINRRNGEG